MLRTMEHRSVKNGAVMNEDRISQLPEALILHILSFLPTKLVITTSLLSKQWRSLWKMVPNLQFGPEDYESEHHTFSEIVSKTFLSHKAPVLKSFHLSFGLDKVTPMDIGLWVGMAFARNLRELVLDFHPRRRRDTILFPSSFFACSTLETLKLNTWMTLDISYPVYMKSLKTLHLTCLRYKDEASIRNLLSGCPSLEDLVVDLGNGCGVEIFTIDVPSLKRLSIFDDTGGPEFRGYLITAPSLKSLLIEVLRCPEFSLNAPGLVEANVLDVNYVSSEKFLGSLTSVNRLVLDLSPLEITYPTGSIFYQLVSLEMFTRNEEWWNLLTFMLESSPKLQVLKLTDHCLKIHEDGVVSSKWNEPKYVPECLLSHLETLVWTRFHWGREEEKEVATYILKNARRLKKATFSTNPIESETLNKLKERSKMLRQLEDMDRASNSCHLVFEFDSTRYESDSS